MLTAPIAQTACARKRLSCTRTIGSSSRLIGDGSEQIAGDRMLEFSPNRIRRRRQFHQIADAERQEDNDSDDANGCRNPTRRAEMLLRQMPGDAQDP